MDYYSPLKAEYAAKYDDNPRMDLIESIKEAHGKVLEIGCGAGATGLLVKQKFPDTIYVGLELNEKAADIAKTRLDKVITANIEQANLEQFGIEKGSFDMIICADVLEHLYDPWKVLHTLRDYLKPNGKVLASIPNTQNIGLILQLLSGNWTYMKYGLLDATHIRFFTLKEIYTLFSSTGYQIINWHSILQRNIEQERWPKDIDFGRIVLRDVTKEEAIMFYTFQYIVIAQKIDIPCGKPQGI